MGEGDRSTMNVNPEMMGLGEVTGLSVFPDAHEEDGQNYITFTYAGEEYELAADDAPEADTATLYVNLYTEMQFNFLAMKEQIKEYLEGLDYCTVTNIFTTVEEYRTNANSVKFKRHTTFIIDITKWR